jgi:hypothetical protein
MAVNECEEDNPPKPCAQEGMLRRIPPKSMEGPWALPVGLHKKVSPCLRRSGYAQAGLKLFEAPRPPAVGFPERKFHFYCAP